MRQIVQSLENGRVALSEIPAPALGPTSVRIQTAASVISAGTERMLLHFGKAGWIGKARQQPERVRMVLDKMKADGVASTLEAVRSKLSQPLPLGYASAGVVLEVGSAVTEFRPGDRVASNGAHAECVVVPKNLCVSIPDRVSEEAAAFTVLGAIALEGIRLAQPALGESVAVSGLGLIGLLAVQLLRANGCRVLALDFVKSRLELAERFGAETVDLASGADPERAAERFTNGRGMDAVLITASSKSREPVRQAAAMSRKRGRLVLVGVAGLELSRDDFYKKELSFQVSCSYGPGRYDAAYERNGQDYPLPYVRWTAQRNFEAVLDSLASGKVDVEALITHRFPFERAERAYELIDSPEPHLGIVLEYPRTDENVRAAAGRTISLASSRVSQCASEPGRVRLALIGAGAYASKVLIPAFRKAGSDLDLIVSEGGLSAAHWGRSHGFKRAGTDINSVFADPAIDTVAIATPHDSHASLAMAALEAGKHVFIEKPLALTEAEIFEIEQRYANCLDRRTAPRLMVGFNRRFAPHTKRMKSLLAGLDQPKAMIYTVNAGTLPRGHWAEKPLIGGGRIVGEACHFIDLLRFLAGAPVRLVSAVRAEERAQLASGSISFSLSFEDESVGIVHYLANGHRGFPKERLEIFCAGRILQLDNFRTLTGWGWPRFERMKLWRQDKGAAAMISEFTRSIENGQPAPIPAAEIFEVSRRAIEIAGVAA